MLNNYCNLCNIENVIAFLFNKILNLNIFLLEIQFLTHLNGCVLWWASIYNSNFCKYVTINLYTEDK